MTGWQKGYLTLDKSWAAYVEKSSKEHSVKADWKFISFSGDAYHVTSFDGKHLFFIPSSNKYIYIHDINWFAPYL